MNVPCIDRPRRSAEMARRPRRTGRRAMRSLLVLSALVASGTWAVEGASAATPVESLPAETTAHYTSVDHAADATADATVDLPVPLPVPLPTLPLPFNWGWE